MPRPALARAELRGCRRQRYLENGASSAASLICLNAQKTSSWSSVEGDQSECHALALAFKYVPGMSQHLPISRDGRGCGTTDLRNVALCTLWPMTRFQTASNLCSSGKEVRPAARTTRSHSSRRGSRTASATRCTCSGRPSKCRMQGRLCRSCCRTPTAFVLRRRRDAIRAWG